MARITGEQGASLTNQLQQYLDAAGGEINSGQLQTIINNFLAGGDQLATVSGAIVSGIYKRLNEFDKVEGRMEVVTTGMWSGDVGSLISFFTSSEQVDSTSGKYFWNIYQEDPDDTGSADLAKTQFAVSYGSAVGKGSVTLANNDDALSPTLATYGQYRSLLLQPGDDRFTFLGDAEPDDIYIINIARERYREKVDPGNISLSLSGSLGTFTFIDDSGMKFEQELAESGKVFNIVEGDLQLGTQNDAVISSELAPNDQGYGLFYPDHGIIILNPAAIHSKIGTILGLSAPEEADNTSGAVDKVNHRLIYQAIKDGSDFEARRKENISTSHYFVRAVNREFNFSNNPSFSDEDGEFIDSSFERDPKVYITTVGLFDNANELLAVAKVSSPVAKSFDKEVLIKTKLSF